MALPSKQLMSSALLKYLPQVVINHYKEKSIELGRGPKGESDFKKLIPDQQEINCVSMFIDVAEFTVLTSDLAVFPDGSGQLAAALNNAMISIVSVINKSNGDIVKFAGDAILVVWPLKERAEIPSCIHRVVSIGFSLVNNLEFNTFTILDPDERNFFDNQAQDANPSTPSGIANVTKTLEIKIGISYGLAKILYLGGVPDNIVKTRCEYLPVGPALNEAFVAEGYCSPSMVVVPKKVYDLECIQEAFEMSPVSPKDKKGKKNLPSPSSKKKKFKRNKPSSKGAIKFPSKQSRKNSYSHKGAVVILEDLDLTPTHYKIEKFKKKSNLRRIPPGFTSFEGIGKALWSYVPVAIVPYFSEIALEFWLPEMRTVTTLFCTLNVKQLEVNKLYEDSSLYVANDLNVLAVHEIKQKIQDVFRGIQETVFKYQGTVNKFLVDDKGCSCLIAFGLPPFAHVSDPDRSALCAYGIMGCLAKLKVTAHIGITTGVVYCGAIGGNAGLSAQRIEYTMIGDPINVAARLMVEAKKRQTGIIMDMNTKDLLREKVSTTYLDDVFLKGKGKYDAYKVITSEDDAFVAEWELRRSARIFSSSIFTSQMKLGLAEQHLVSAFTGENLQGKLSKLNIDEEFTSSTYFNKRLEVQSSRKRYETIKIEFFEGGKLKTINLPIDKKTLKKNDDINNVKLQALKELQKQHWKELKKYAFTEEEQIKPEALKRKVTESLLHIHNNPEEIRLLKIAARYSLYWKLDDERLFEVNDAMSLARFKVPTRQLTFRILKTLTSHWKLQSHGHTFMKRRRHETTFRENCFSLVERLHSLANDFYVATKRRKHNTRPATKLKTILLEASNGTGKTYAVSDLINTVLKTTSFEVLISGGDPFEDGQNTQPFIVIATVIRQLLELRANKANVNNRNLFQEEFVENVLKSSNDTLRLATSKPQHPAQYAKIINESLARAQAIFDSCNVPHEAKAEEKDNHIFDTKKLYLLDEIIGTEFGKGGEEAAASLTFSGSLAASRALSVVITKQNFALGEDFKSRKVDRMSARLNSRMTQRMSMMKNIKAAQEKRKHITRKLFLSQLEEPTDKNRKVGPTENNEEIDDGRTYDSQDSITGYEDEKLEALNDSLNANTERPNEIAEKFLTQRTGFLSLTAADQILSPEQKKEVTDEEEEAQKYLSDMKDVVKLIAAILAGLTSDAVPLLIHIDNAHRADPFSLLVIQELTQWWSRANIMLLLCTQKSFSADVGKSNIGNYVVEAGKRMSVVTLKFNTDIVELSDIVYDMETSPNETFAANRTSTTVLLAQLKELTNTIRIDLVPDKKFTKEIMEIAAYNLDLFDATQFSEPIGIDDRLFKYLRDRAGGHFLYLEEALRLFRKHRLIRMDLSTKSLGLTPAGNLLFQKALSPSRQTKRFQRPSKKKKNKTTLGKTKTRPSLLLPVSRAQGSGKNKEPYRVPIRNLSRLIPGSLNAAFSEYFDSLGVKEQLLLKCAALISRANREVEKGMFTFKRVKKVCPFLQELNKNQHIENEVKDAFELLKTTQLISPVEQRFSGNLNKNYETAKYKFRSEWYSDILISRLLPSQLERIQKRIEHLKREAEEKFMLKVPESQHNFRGWLTVKKAGRHGFKKRFCVLEKAVMFLYKEDPVKNESKNTCRTKIVLTSDEAKVSYYDGPPFRTRLLGSGDDSERSFLVRTNLFFEMKSGSGLEQREAKQWLCVARDDAEAELWHTKIKLQIRFSKNKRVKLKFD